MVSWCLCVRHYPFLKCEHEHTCVAGKLLGKNFNRHKILIRLNVSLGFSNQIHFGQLFPFKGGDRYELVCNEGLLV